MREPSKNPHHKTAGRVIAGLGLVMILANALGYLLAWPADLMPLLIIGLILVAVGVNLASSR